MAHHLKVDAAQALSTAHVASNEAEQLRHELAGIFREWDDVSAGWSGAAASAFASRWDEWHQGATQLVETLDESSRLLAEAAVAYDAQETDSVRSLRSIAAEVDR